MPPKKALSLNNPDLSPYVRLALESSASNKDADKEKRASHEDYSLILADRILREVVTTPTVRHLILSMTDSRVIPPPESDSRAVAFFKNLVSGELDSDRMDYLRRDSLLCGVPYGQFDFNRLASGLLILENKASKAFTLGIKRNAISALEDFLFARYQMHIQIYTHKVDVACNVSLKTMLSEETGVGFTLPSKIDDYARFDDESFIHFMKEKYSKNNKLTKDLHEIIFDRKLWVNAFESYSQDTTIEQSIIDGLKTVVPKDRIAVAITSKPFTNSKILDVKVVCNSLAKGQVAVNELPLISRLIDRYNGSFKVTRVFVHPDDEDLIDNVKQRIIDPSIGLPTLKEAK